MPAGLLGTVWVPWEADSERCEVFRMLRRSGLGISTPVPGREWKQDGVEAGEAGEAEPRCGPQGLSQPRGEPWSYKCALRAVLHWAKMVELLYSLITW